MFFPLAHSPFVLCIPVKLEHGTTSCQVYTSHIYSFIIHENNQKRHLTTTSNTSSSPHYSVQSLPTIVSLNRLSRRRRSTKRAARIVLHRARDRIATSSQPPGLLSRRPVTRFLELLTDLVFGPEMVPLRMSPESPIVPSSDSYPDSSGKYSMCGCSKVTGSSECGSSFAGARRRRRTFDER